MSKIKSVLILVIVVWTEVIASANSHIHSQAQQQESPYFLTLSTDYTSTVGSTIVLHCKITKTVDNNDVLLWKRGMSILTVDKYKITLNPRIRVFITEEINETSNFVTITYNLEIRNIEIRDMGSYVCQISTAEPKEITHTLNIVVPPKITFVTSSSLNVHKGGDVQMQCEAIGNPKPQIIWIRSDNSTINGQPNITKNVLQLSNVNRHSSGSYKCLADNQVGAMDSREFLLNVLYRPEIKLNQRFVHTGIGNEAHLDCIVYAEPPPNVIWFKDGAELETRIIDSRYRLVIHSVTTNDFGKYICKAKNSLGHAKEWMKLTGTPTICIMHSPRFSSYSNQYNISWSVETYAPIEEYRLLYAQQSEHLIYHESEDKLSSTNSSQTSFELSITPPTTTLHNKSSVQHHSRQHMNFVLNNLTASTNYTVQVQARNEYGWNALSKIYHFTTPAEDLELDPPASTYMETIGQYSGATKEVVVDRILKLVRKNIFFRSNL